MQKAWLPDAPSSTSTPQVYGDFFEASRLTATRGAATIAAAVSWNHAWSKPSANNGNVSQNSNDFFATHLYPALLRRNLDYHPSTSSSLMGRATYAASRILITRDDSGRGRVNSSYFLGVLGSAVLHTAYRPYWNRSVSAPFSDFGSTIGNDAGMNLLHEFRPGLESLMKNHTPKFVSRIEERIGRN
jgi:hypothetical protein